MLLASGGAYAYWTAGGSGDGSAATGTNEAIIVTQTSTPTNLYPGGPTAVLEGAFNNDNDSMVFVNEVDAEITSVTRTPEAIAASLPCAISNYQLNGFPVNLDTEVASGDDQGAWGGASIQLLNTSSNQDGCKGATVNIDYTSN